MGSTLKKRPFGNEKYALYPLMTEILFNFAVRKAQNRMLCKSNSMDLKVKLYICYYV